MQFSEDLGRHCINAPRTFSYLFRFRTKNEENSTLFIGGAINAQSQPHLRQDEFGLSNLAACSIHPQIQTGRNGCLLYCV
jgi:hypothetical protein